MLIAPAREQEMAWLSAHLFLPTLNPMDVYGYFGDHAVKRVAAPLIAGWRREGLNQYFFVRYNELGPHLRLRLCVPKRHVTDAAMRLACHVAEIAPGAAIEPWPEGTTTVPSALRPANPGNLAVHSLRWFAYEPEVERYGGFSALGIAERVFAASSDLALSLLEDLDPTNRSARLGRALLAFIVTLRVFHKDRANVGAVAAQYGSRYLRAFGQQWVDNLEGRFAAMFARQSEQFREQVDAIWGALEDNGVHSTVQQYVAALTREKEELRRLCVEGQIRLRRTTRATWLDCAVTIVASYLHMMNNRLGVTVLEESYLARIIEWTSANPNSNAAR